MKDAKRRANISHDLIRTTTETLFVFYSQSAKEYPDRRKKKRLLVSHFPTIQCYTYATAGAAAAGAPLLSEFSEVLLSL